MVRPSGRSRRGRVSKRRGGGRRSDRDRAPTAEQLDFEMELMRAKHEGREDEFRKENAAKRQAARKKNLDDEMDEYFKNRDAGKDDDKKDDESTKDADAGQSSTVDDPNQVADTEAAAPAESALEPNK